MDDRSHLTGKQPDEAEEDLGSLPRPENPLHEFALLGGDDDDLAVASGYLQVAEIAATYWCQRGPHDALPVPILYNYRHSVELTLKALIGITAHSLLQAGNTSDKFSPEAVREQTDHHNIKQLADQLDRNREILDPVGPRSHIDSTSRQLLEWLNSEDQSGETYRYAAVKTAGDIRPARPTQENFNFYEQINELHKLACLLYADYVTYLSPEKPIYHAVESLPRPAHRINEIAVVGGHEDDLQIALGFLLLAETAATYWCQRGPDNTLPIPILYNYRHSIELTLKWLIRFTARCVRVQGHDSPESLDAEKLDQKLRNTHNIKKLAERLDRYLKMLDPHSPTSRIDRASQALLNWLDNEDKSGEAFRYAAVGRGTASAPARPQSTMVNFYEQVNELHKLAWLLYAGYSGYLDNYAEMQSEFLAAYSDMQDDFANEMDTWGP